LKPQRPCGRCVRQLKVDALRIVTFGHDDRRPPSFDIFRDMNVGSAWPCWSQP
jgi:hypothetical protein